MQFKMTCPKCLSLDYSIERDRRATYQGDANSGLVFSCRCGKQLFGEQVMAEYDRQRREHDANHGPDSNGGPNCGSADLTERDAPSRPRLEDEQALQRAMAYRAERMEPDAQAADTLSARAEPSRASSVDDDDDDGETCAWDPCNNPRRDSSKYCSRACSNKNARWRHKQRKREDQEAA